MSESSGMTELNKVLGEAFADDPSNACRAHAAVSPVLQALIAERDALRQQAAYETNVAAEALSDRDRLTAEVLRLTDAVMESDARGARLQAERDAMAKDAARLDYMDRLCAEGCAPAIVNDDDGRWAFSDSGTSPVPPGDGPHTEWVSVTAFVEPVMWRSTIREAIDAALSPATSTGSEVGK